MYDKCAEWHDKALQSLSVNEGTADGSDSGSDPQTAAQTQRRGLMADVLLDMGKAFYMQQVMCMALDTSSTTAKWGKS